MVKFLKATVSDQDYLIPCHKVVSVRTPAASRVDIILDTPLQTDAAAGAGEVAVIQVVASGVSGTPATKVFVNEVVAAIGKALEHSWADPIVPLGGLTHPITAVSYLSVDYSS